MQKQIETNQSSYNYSMDYFEKLVIDNKKTKISIIVDG
jgi:hypothetical protein